MGRWRRQAKHRPLTESAEQLISKGCQLGSHLNTGLHFKSAGLSKKISWQHQQLPGAVDNQAQLKSVVTNKLLVRFPVI